MLTLKQTLDTIADAYETKPEDRTERQKHLTSSGICHALTNLLDRGYILTPDYSLMIGIVEGEVIRLRMLPYRLIRSFTYDGRIQNSFLRSGYFYLLRTREGDETRAAFCRKQAAMLEGEK